MKPNAKKLPREPRYLQTEDVLERFGISRFTLRRWIESEEIAFPTPITVGRRHYFNETDIFKFEMRRAGLDPDVPETLAGLNTVSGVIVDYAEFVKAMAERRASLNMSNLELELKSGLQEGYVTKLENWERPYGRGVGPDTMPLWLGGLRVGIILVDLPRRPRRRTGGISE